MELLKRWLLRFIKQDCLPLPVSMIKVFESDLTLHSISICETHRLLFNDLSVEDQSLFSTRWRSFSRGAHKSWCTKRHSTMNFSWHIIFWNLNVLSLQLGMLWCYPRRSKNLIYQVRLLQSSMEEIAQDEPNESWKQKWRSPKPHSLCHDTLTHDTTPRKHRDWTIVQYAPVSRLLEYARWWWFSFKKFLQFNVFTPSSFLISIGLLNDIANALANYDKRMMPKDSQEEERQGQLKKRWSVQAETKSFVRLVQLESGIDQKEKVIVDILKRKQQML